MTANKFIEIRSEKVLEWERWNAYVQLYRDNGYSCFTIRASLKNGCNTVYEDGRGGVDADDVGEIATEMEKKVRKQFEEETADLRVAVENFEGAIE